MIIEPIKRPSPADWEAKTGKEKWDIMVALRGPDCASSEAIKWCSTSVIRGTIINAIRVGGLVNDDLRIIILPSQGPDTKLVGWHWMHFREHIATAAQWLGIPIAYVPWDAWWDNRKKGCTDYIKLMIEHVPDEYKSELKRHLKTIGGSYATSD